MLRGYTLWVNCSLSPPLLGAPQYVTLSLPQWISMASYTKVDRPKITLYSLPSVTLKVT